MLGHKACIFPSVDSEEDSIVISVLMINYEKDKLTLISMKNAQKQPQKKGCSYGNLQFC